MDDGHARTPFDQLTMLVESPLPALEPPQFQNLGLQKPPNIINAYRMILHAEATAIAQMDKENVIPARVAGHLLLELCPQRCILGDRPYERIIEELMKPDRPIDNNDDLVFEIGQRYRDSLIRGCAFDYSPVLFHISVDLKLGCPARRTPHFPHTPRVLPMTTY